LPPLATGRQPDILLDPVEKKATGFSGCNSFFGGYELDGASLKFGSFGFPRMCCEDVSGDVEMRSMQALDKTSGWKIRDGELLLVDGSEVVARFVKVQGDEPPSDLGSMTFLSTWILSERGTLSHGEHRGPAESGSVPEIIVKLTDKGAFGVVDGRETGVILTSAGDSGTFYDLALFLKGPNGWVNTDTVFLGDRRESADHPYGPPASAEALR
jgi:hypothetical protein